MPVDVAIEEPQPNTTVSASTEIALSGSAYDLQDGDLYYSDEAFAWSSDPQGDLGTGELLYMDNLRPGTHTITLKASNSFKLSSSTTVTFYVGVTPPTPTPAPTAAATSTLARTSGTPSPTATPVY